MAALGLGQPPSALGQPSPTALALLAQEATGHWAVDYPYQIFLG